LVAVCVLIAAAFQAAFAAESDAPVTRAGTLVIEQTSGNECPGAQRLERVQLVVTPAVVPVSGAVFLGDELVKSFAGDPATTLRLRDPLVLNEDAAANWIAFDRWPDPTTAKVGFQFFRHRCRVTAARIEFAGDTALPDDRARSHVETLADMAALARIYAAGRAGDPRPGSVEAAGIHERLSQRLGARHAVTLEARFVQMLNAQDTGDLARATALGEELRDTLGELYGRDAGAVARLRTSLAFTQWRAGHSAAAIAETEAALAAIGAINGKTDRFYIATQRTLAEYLLRSSRHREALEAATSAEEIARTTYGEDSLDRIDSARTLFRVYFISGRSDETRRILTTLLPQVKRKLGPDSPAYVGLVEALSNAAYELRLFDEADAATDFVLQYRERTLGPTNPSTVSALVNAAIGRAQSGRLEEAERMFLDAYQRLPRSGARHESTPTIEVNLAQLYLDRGDLERAKPFVDLAVQRMREYYGDDDAKTLKALGARGEWLRRTGDPQGALQVLADVRARQVAVGGTVRLDSLYTLSQMARAFQALDQVDAAADRLQELVTLAEAHRDGVAADATSRRDVLSRWVADYKHLAVLRLQQERVDAAFTLAELSKGRSLLDQMSERQARAAGGLSEAERRELQRLALDIVSLEERLADTAPASAAAVDLVAELVEKRALYRHAKAVIAAAHPRYAALTRLALVDAPKASALLAKDEVAVSYLISDDSLLIFTLDAGGLRGVARPLSQSDRASIDAFARLAGRAPYAAGGRLWQSPDGTRSWSIVKPNAAATQIALPQLARELGALLLDPARAALRGKRRVLVAPDGPLATLPFELLTREGAPLVERHEVAYVQSMSVYARMLDRARAPNTQRRRSVLAIGAPTFGAVDQQPADRETPATTASRYRSSGLAWQPLPEARREIEAIARTFPGTRVLLGDDASEDRLLALEASGELANYRYLHFATHAFFSSERPELSAIVLHQPGSAMADGFVTVAELPRYRLNSELTVLSACETAAGRIVDGEGVMGFAYALLVAGNRSTIAALWKVPDESTRVFMERFFVALRDGASHAAALASAKRALQRMPRFAAPLHWAGFVLYGR
jgi:CHAT domain-containing protein/tetratricopeptide (TPR) repeat protein